MTFYILKNFILHHKIILKQIGKMHFGGYEADYSRVRNKRRDTLIIFWIFFPGAISLLKGATFIDF